MPRPSYHRSRACWGGLSSVVLWVLLIASFPGEVAGGDSEARVLKTSWSVGDRFHVSHHSLLEMTLSMTIEGRTQLLEMVNDDRFELDVEVQDAKDGDLLACAIVAQQVVRKGTPPGGGPVQELLRTTKAQPFTGRWSKDGTLTEVVPSPAALASEGKPAEPALPREVLDSAADAVRCDLTDFGISGPVMMGSTWPISRSLFLGGGGTVVGSSTVTGLEGRGADEAVLLSVILDVRENQGELGGTMTAHLEGTVRIDGSTGRCRSVQLAGPMGLEAALMGVPMTGNGRLSISAVWR